MTLAEVATGAERMVSVNGRRLHVKIPAGVNDGSKVKLSGAVDGGDLVINVRVKPDPRFERRGSDLRTELPITLADALLGGEVPVPTPTGSVKLRIRPNTQNGQEIRSRAEGSRSAARRRRATSSSPPGSSCPRSTTRLAPNSSRSWLQSVSKTHMITTS